MSDKNLQTATKAFLKLLEAHPTGKSISTLAKFASEKTMELVGNLNKDEKDQINKSLKDEKLKDKEVGSSLAGGKTKKEIAEANPIKRGKTQSKANPGDAGGSIAKLAKGGFPDLSGDGEVTQKDILMGKGVIKMKKGGIVKKKSSRTRIAKRGFGIAKRGY